MVEGQFLKRHQSFREKRDVRQRRAVCEGLDSEVRHAASEDNLLQLLVVEEFTAAVFCEPQRMPAAADRQLARAVAAEILGGVKGARSNVADRIRQAGDDLDNRKQPQLLLKRLSPR